MFLCLEVREWFQMLSAQRPLFTVRLWFQIEGRAQSLLFVLKESVVNTDAAGRGLFAELIVV